MREAKKKKKKPSDQAKKTNKKVERNKRDLHWILPPKDKELLVITCYNILTYSLILTFDFILSYIL